VRPEEREAILREDAPRPQTARERRQLGDLEEDLRSSPLRSKPLPLRLRNFRPTADGYLASLGGPLPYMARLREIEAMTAAHQEALAEERRRLASEVPPERFEEAWHEVVTRWSFDEVNDLIDRHNRYYPIESRLPMDPKTKDFALVAGQDYRRRPLDAAWALERFPASVDAALSATPA
jgi:hypothetical protein